jgi:hypothetical protein
LAEGEKVEFDLIHGSKGYFAQNVTGPNFSPVQGNPNAMPVKPIKPKYPRADFNYAGTFDARNPKDLGNSTPSHAPVQDYNRKSSEYMAMISPPAAPFMYANPIFFVPSSTAPAPGIPVAVPVATAEESSKKNSASSISSGDLMDGDDTSVQSTSSHGRPGVDAGVANDSGAISYVSGMLPTLSPYSYYPYSAMYAPVPSNYCFAADLSVTESTGNTLDEKSGPGGNEMMTMEAMQKLNLNSNLPCQAGSLANAMNYPTFGYLVPTPGYASMGYQYLPPSASMYPSPPEATREEIHPLHLSVQSKLEIR